MSKMSEVVKNYSLASLDRKRLEDAIDNGKFELLKEAKRYSERPPYQYTSLEPKSWGTRHTERRKP